MSDVPNSHFKKKEMMFLGWLFLHHRVIVAEDRMFKCWSTDAVLKGNLSHASALILDKGIVVKPLSDLSPPPYPGCHGPRAGPRLSLAYHTEVSSRSPSF